MALLSLSALGTVSLARISFVENAVPGTIQRRSGTTTLFLGELGLRVELWVQSDELTASQLS